MKLFRSIHRLVLLPVALSSTVALAEPDAGQIAISVGRLLEQGHYMRHKLDDEMSQRLLKNYLEVLDVNHLFFTQQDVDGFTAKYGRSLDDDVLLGNAEPAFAIHKVFTSRVEQRVAQARRLLNGSFDFSRNESIMLNRQKAPWPADESEAEQIWAGRVAAEFLQEKLSEHPIEPPEKILGRRYDQLLRNVHEQNQEEVLKLFLLALALSYDPHSEYLSKSDLENFGINMRLSLVGIGAVLETDDGYTKIREIVPGGPADLDGRLKVNDRICAVAQGDGEFEDVVGMKIDKVVQRIRGEKNTKVRLQIIPARASDPSERKIIEVVRDEVKLKEQEARAEIIEHPSPHGGQTVRIGWITLPSFYADMERAGAPGAKSTTKDVSRLLERLKREGIAGLVIDLRRNGGGSLEEARDLTGLFIGRGPVVQAKDANGRITVSKSRSAAAYTGPLLVVTNRLSASASEIFAGALQDYNRAVIVGDEHTFGKGTVQTMLEIGRFIPFLGSDTGEAGALKLTIQKFYRVSGGSTQLYGVRSDIRLPSIYDYSEIGEASLKDPLPYDELEAVPYEKFDRPLFLPELKKRSAARIANDREFRYVKEDLARLTARLESNKISLNEKVRRAEIAEQKARKERRNVERAKRSKRQEKVFAITLDNVDDPDLHPANNDKTHLRRQRRLQAALEGEETDENEEDEIVDAVRNESLNIMADLIHLSNNTARTAQVHGR